MRLYICYNKTLLHYILLLGYSKLIQCFSSLLSQKTDAGGQLEMVIKITSLMGNGRQNHKFIITSLMGNGRQNHKFIMEIHAGWKSRGGGIRNNYM